MYSGNLKGIFHIRNNFSDLNSEATDTKTGANTRKMFVVPKEIVAYC
jgi:hypothetical protein